MESVFNPFSVKEAWIKGVQHFLLSTDKGTIKKNIEVIERRCKESDEYKQAYDELVAKWYNVEGRDDELFFWRLYKPIFDKEEKKKFSERVIEIINEKKKKADEDFDYRIEKVLFLISNAKSVFKNQMKDIEDGRQAAIRKHKALMDRWDKIEEICKRQNKDYLELIDQMKENRSKSSDEIDISWARMDEETKVLNYNSNYNQYRSERHARLDREFLVNHSDHPFIKKSLLECEGNNKDKEMTKKIIEEINLLIMENNLTFIEKEGIEALAQSH